VHCNEETEWICLFSFITSTPPSHWHMTFSMWDIYEIESNVFWLHEQKHENTSRSANTEKTMHQLCFSAPRSYLPCLKSYLQSYLGIHNACCISLMHINLAWVVLTQHQCATELQACWWRLIQHCTQQAMLTQRKIIDLAPVYKQNCNKQQHCTAVYAVCVNAHAVLLKHMHTRDS